MTNQKLYLIPTTPTYEYEPYNHIFLVTASSDQEAYERAKFMLHANIPQELPEYANLKQDYFGILCYVLLKKQVTTSIEQFIEKVD